jgi:hypothetical protein
MTKYEILEQPFADTIIIRTDEDGKVWNIPTDPSNSDYQAYLNKDKAEQSTPIVTADE